MAPGHQALSEAQIHSQSAIKYVSRLSDCLLLHTTPQHGTDSASSTPSNHTSEPGLDTIFTKDDNVQTLKNDCIVSYKVVREDVVDSLA